MTNLLEPGRADELKARLALLCADSPRQWGKMSAAQMVEHCARGIETANGDMKLPRMLLGRLIGWAIKPLALKDDEPIRKNSPTSPMLIVVGEPDIEAQKQRLCGLVDRFVAGGLAGCTAHPHIFFGKMTPEEWSVLMWKHLDHHLRQFGV